MSEKYKLLGIETGRIQSKLPTIHRNIDFDDIKSKQTSAKLVKQTYQIVIYTVLDESEPNTKNLAEHLIECEPHSAFDLVEAVPVTSLEMVDKDWRNSQPYGVDDGTVATILEELNKD